MQEAEVRGRGKKRLRGKIFPALLLCAFLFQVTACEDDPLSSYYNQVFVKPRPWGLGDTPEGSPTFQKGWEEGCNTGLGVYGGRHYRKPAYKYQQDLSLINNEEYYRAWRDAYTYCRWYVWNWTKRAEHGNSLF